MFEWRLDPKTEWRIPEATDFDGGYQALLVAGLDPVTLLADEG